MARIRTIKPEFWSSPSMRGADPWARLLFIAMWNWADDTGRGTANVRELAAFAFPDDEDPLAPTVAELPSLLAEVRGRWDVIFYEVSGRRYYAIPSWEGHQRNERRAKSRHPAPDEGKEYDPGPPDQGKRRGTRKSTEVPSHIDGSTAHTHGRSGPGTGEQGNRGTGETDSLRSSGATAPTEVTDITPRVVVSAWVEAMNANEVAPTQGMRNQVGKLAKELLANNDPDRVMAAARQAGAKGYATIDRELTAMAGRPLRAVNGIRFPAPGYDENGDPLRDPKTGAWMER
jgi:hypothetical protein